MIDALDVVTSLTDNEFTGKVGNALHHSNAEQFGLLMAMMHQDILERPAFSEVESAVNTCDIPMALKYYPKALLKTDEEEFKSATRLSEWLHSDNMTAIRLRHSMFPPSLSLHNDSQRIPDNVIDNMGYHAQQKIRESTPEPQNIPVDETALYEVLSGMAENAQLSTKIVA